MTFQKQRERALPKEKNGEEVPRMVKVQKEGGSEDMARVCFHVGKK